MDTFPWNCKICRRQSPIADWPAARRQNNFGRAFAGEDFDPGQEPERLRLDVQWVSLAAGRFAFCLPLPARSADVCQTALFRNTVCGYNGDGVEGSSSTLI